jgi:branched-chain amino acid transport system ATP-binding protein
MSMSAPLLELEAVAAGYGGPAVIRDISLIVRTGEVVAMLGPNGAGKTTTLRVASALLPPLRGSVKLAGEPTSGMKAVALARRGLGHVPEGRGIFYGLTVDEHFRIGPRGEHLDTEAAFAYFPALEPLRERRAGLLSGGEQQMLAIARAMARRPRLLLLDELSLGLAPVIVESLLPVVRQYVDETGAGVLMVEQHMHLALKIADRAYVLNHGEIAGEGEAQLFRDNEQLVAREYFGESPPPDGPSNGQATEAAADAGAAPDARA